MSIGELDRLHSLVLSGHCKFEDFFKALLDLNSLPNTRVYSPELVFKNAPFNMTELSPELKAALKIIN